MTGSVPGARPMPRSMRPGYAASSRANCSATTSGAWLGSITPPEPTRMRSVARRHHRDEHGRVGRGDRRHVVVLGEPVAPEPELVGDPGQRRGSRQGRRSSSGRCGRAPGRARTARGSSPGRNRDRARLAIPLGRSRGRRVDCAELRRWRRRPRRPRRTPRSAGPRRSRAAGGSGARCRRCRR